MKLKQCPFCNAKVWREVPGWPLHQLLIHDPHCLLSVTLLKGFGDERKWNRRVSTDITADNPPEREE